MDAQALQVFDKIFGAARASAVYSEPVTAGAYTIITASEVAGGGGFGSATGSIAGSGGGGGASGRPVAVIVVGPDGVQVKPIFDVTKIGLAVLTTWAAMLTTLVQRRRQKKFR
jgi:uncharacterized spore protein YtfJ